MVVKKRFKLPGTSVNLVLNFLQQMLQLLSLLRQAILLSHQSEQFSFQSRV